MLHYHSVAHLAHPKHSPTRERREVWFAVKGSSASGSESNEKKLTPFQQLSVKIEQRLEEARQMISIPEILERENVDALRESFFRTTDIIRNLLNFANSAPNEESGFQALVKAEEALCTFEQTLYTADDSTRIRRRLEKILPSLRNRKELDEQEDADQRRIEYGKQHERALALLRSVSDPKTLPEDRQNAVRDAAAILSGLEEADAGLEAQRKQNIAKIIQGTRESLKTLLPQVQKLDALKDSILDGQFFNGQAIINKTHNDAMKLLEDAENDHPAAKSADLLRSAEQAKSRLQKLEQFVRHVTKVEAKQEPFTAEQLATLTGKADALYSRDDESIYLHPDLDNDPKLKQEKLAHEKRHAYLHALDGLDENALIRLYNETIASPVGQRFKAILQQLTSSDKAHFAYKLYGDQLEPAFEELLVRSCDQKAGILKLDPRETELLTLLAQSHPPKNVSTEAKTEDAGGGDRFSAKAEDDADDDGTAKKPDEKEEDAKPEKEASAKELLKKVHSTVEKTQSIIKDLDETESFINSSIKDPARREQTLTKWKAHRNMLQDSVITLWGYEQILKDVDAWHSGSTPPEEFNKVLAKITKAPAGSAGAVDIRETLSTADWSAANNSTKGMLAQQASKDIGVGQLLKGIDDHLKLFDSELPKAQDNIIDLKKAKKQGAFGGPQSLLGLEFYSINQIIESVKNVYESYSKAWGNWHQLKVSKVSNMLGKATKGLPFYDQASIALEMDLDHKNDEVKDEYKKHLEHDLASFDHCFADGHPDHSLFHTNINDPNRFRGTLEYMASNGWLYEIDAIKGTIFNVPIAPYLPSTWAPIRKEMYIRDLEQQNSSGEEKASKNGLSRVDTYPDIPPMMDVLRDELKRHNFWAAKGILERALQKGKKGETSTWASTIILNAIRNDETTRRFFPKGLMDQIGNIAISSPAWTATFFKLDRHHLVDFQNDKVSFEDAGTLALSIDSVEKQIMRIRRASNLTALKIGEHGDPKDQEIMDHLVAKVLACQVVDGGDINEKWSESLSIFDSHPGFANFRTEVANFTGTIEPGKCDDDFYNGVDNGASESILKSPANFDTIFQPTSQGTFVNAQKAKFFLEQLVFEFDRLNDRYQSTKADGDMGKINGAKNALLTYQEMMFKKMSYVATNAWQQGTCGLLVNIKGRCHDVGPGTRVKESSDYIIYEMARRGMFPWDDDLLKLLDNKETHFQGRFALQVSRLGKNMIAID